MSSDKSMPSDSRLAIAAENLGKCYHLYDAPSDRLKQLLFGRWRRFYKEYIALNDVSFYLPHGEVLGIVGRNGAGKSTLLQMICGTLTPTSGNLNINGRIAALLELGAGFNPEFTGRENIYLSAAIMGIEQKKIDEKFDEIVAFSGIRDFIEQPVKTYSSGMYVRLAFSVATSVEPDILVIDEALSVGDGDFARRSFERIMSMRDQGKSILFCSHSLYQIEALCTQAIWLDNGQVRAFGKPEDICPAYQNFLDKLNTTPDNTVKQQADRMTAQGGSDTTVSQQGELTSDNKLQNARITRVEGTVDGASGKALYIASRESTLVITIEFQTFIENEIPGIAVTIVTEGGYLVTSTGNWLTGVHPDIDEEGQGRIQVIFERLPLLKGTYHVGALLFCPRGIFQQDMVDPAITLKVTQPNKERGVAYLPHQWHSQPNIPSDREAQVQTEKQGKRWRTVDADQVAEADILGLFNEVFGYPMDAALWRWKYRFAAPPGAVVLDQDNQLVAFTGGMPRQGVVFGQPKTLVQMGDVMVDSSVRGLFGKKGPFFLAAHHYLAPRVGPGLCYSVAFGFPHPRACRVGVLRGLYNEVDVIKEPHWRPLTATKDQATKDQSDIKWEPLKAIQDNEQAITNQLWDAMTQDTKELALGIRDSQWIKYRYLDKPNADYALYFVLPSDGCAPLGLIVLNYHSDGRVELLDMVGSKSSVKSLLIAARRITHEKQARELFSWMTPSVLTWVQGTGEKIRDTGVVVPGCNINSPEHALRLKNSWWLMGGDSDFR